MAKFEVFIPMAGSSKGVVITTESADYMEALEEALTSKGLADCMKHILCDVKENGLIVVTDTDSRRKFYLREVDPANTTDIRELVEEKKSGWVADKITPKDELLADLFTEVMDGWGMPQQKGIDFFLDLALKYIPCESGSFARSDLSTTDMEFVSCRGPKAESVLGIKVRVGQGLVGFAAKHSCYIAVGDVQKDPRFFKDISQKIGYETNSIVCVPVKSMETNITFGVLELINKKGSSRFDADDMEAMRFIGEKMGEYFHMIWTGTNNTFE
ncbi:GAF domain-containing protein [bacterium]|nr:GAF domain-containing protein [bacterium]